MGFSVRGALPASANLLHTLLDLFHFFIVVLFIYRRYVICTLKKLKAAARDSSGVSVKRSAVRFGFVVDCRRSNVVVCVFVVFC